MKLMIPLQNGPCTLKKILGPKRLIQFSLMLLCYDKLTNLILIKKMYFAVKKKKKKLPTLATRN